MNKVSFGTSDYPEPDPNAAAQAERDRNFNIGVEAAAVWHDERADQFDTVGSHRKAGAHWSHAEAIRKLKRKVD